jgi:diguanylate cyclase (GGDEF)-like protein
LGNILIANPDPGERFLLSELASKLGTLYLTPSVEKAMTALRSRTYDLVITDVDQALDPSLRSHLPLAPCVILTGRRETRLKEAIRNWPSEQFVDYIQISGEAGDIVRARRIVATAWEYGRLKSTVAELKASNEVTENRLRQISEEIKGLGSSLTTNIVKELEKRIAVELRYRRFQRMKEGIEDTLRRLYSADDVSNLLDIVYNIKDLLQAEGISLYLSEEKERFGKIQKPLIWDDSIPENFTVNRNIALDDAADFASFVGRAGGELNVARPEEDERYSSRYRELLRKPLRGLMAAPLTHGGNIIGLIEVYNKLDASGRPAEFGPEDQRLLRGLCEHVALAITKLNLIQYDALTGLLRPDPFFEKAIHKLEIQRKRRQETGVCAMVMGDVDWFKQYNDRNGHEAGNRLLRELANIMKTSIREDDLLCRYGGEEFLFLLCGIKTVDEAAVLTDRIRRKIAEHHFENEEFQPRGNLTMSFGVTMIEAEDGRGSDPVTKAFLRKVAGEADLALAEAKGKKRPGLEAVADPESAKNRVCIYPRKAGAVPAGMEAKETPGGPSFVERRRHPRSLASTLCIYRENGRHHVVTTIDLSLGGVKLSSRTAFSPSRALELFLVLGDQAQKFHGEVVYSHRASAESPYFHSGVQFRDVGIEDARVLEDYLLNLRRAEAVPA